MAEYRSSLTAQEIEDSLLKSKNTVSSASKIDEAVQFYKDSLSPLHITNLNSADSAYFTLSRSFTLDTEGDYVEFTARMTDMASAYAGTLGMVGKKEVASNNCIGYLSATDFRMRGNEATWLLFGDPGVQGDAWNTYKVVCEDVGTTYALYINGSKVGSSQTIVQPIIIDNIGASYGANYTSMEMKYFKVRKGNDVIEAYDFLGNSDLTNYNATETIIPGINLSDNSRLTVNFSFNKIEIFKPQPNGDHVRYTYERFINTDNTSLGGTANADNWRISLCDHIDSDGNYVGPITNGGNWETAIKVSGADDFMGGAAHGDEVLSHFVVLVDGVKVDHTTDQELDCFEIEFIQRSDLTVPPNGANAGSVCANDVKRWRFFSRKPNEFYHRVKWGTSQTITDSYLWMIPIRRKLNNDDTGTQITDTFMTGPLYEEVDMSNAGSNSTAYNGDASNGDVMIWGDTLGYSARTKFKKGWDAPNRQFFVSGSTSYNKNYFDCSGDITTSVGQIQEIELEFDINVKG